jgi:hypothetical protein
MGNYRYLRNRGHQVQDEWQGPPVKVIRPDGIVEVIKKPMMASELMSQHPGHYVCHSSAMIAALTMKSTLVGNRELEGGRLYYILPSHKFEQDEEEGKGLKCGQTPNGGSRRKDFTLEIKQSKTSPGFAQVTVRGHVQGGASNNAIAYSSSPNFRNVYNSTRLPPQSWKPQLETINEVVQGTLSSRRRNIQSFVRWRSLRKS